jgi:hypothetical protein
MTTTLAAPASPVALPRPSRRGPALALAFSSAVAAVWITVAGLAAGRGFDLTDEGFYLLSYRWWAVDHRNFTGVAYIYGPLFDLIGHDVAGLRLIRLGTVVAAHLLFGWAFMTWLRRRRPAAPPTRLWEAAGATAILGAGGVTYSWLPATPGYNDVVLLGAMLGLAVVCVLGPRTWPAGALGLIAVPVLLTKWAAVSVLLPVLVTAVVILHGYGWRPLVRAAGWCMGGFAAGVALTHFLVVPLNVALPPLLEVNRLLAASSFAVPVLLEHYWTTTRPTLGEVARHYGLLLLAVAALTRTRPTSARLIPLVRASAVLGVVGFAIAAWHTATAGGLGGGSANANHFPVPALAVVLAALAAIRGDRLVLALFASVPVAYAFGTSNAPLKISMNALGIWMAVLIAALTALPAAHRAARALLAAVAAGALIAASCIGVGGSWLHPYRGRPNVQATAPVPGVPELASLRLDPVSARRYATLRARLAPYLDPPGRPIIALDKMPGLVFLLGGRTVGEGWYDPADRPRTAAGIRAECGRFNRRPLLILNRPMVPADRTMLGACGTGYRQLAPPRETAGYTVYVPS